MNLLNKLSQFYRNERSGLPHAPAYLWELGWRLADILERYGIDAWRVSASWPKDWEGRFLDKLRQSPDAAAIDTAVNLLHQALLDSQREPESCLLAELGGDIVLYLLSRGDNGA